MSQEDLENLEEQEKPENLEEQEKPENLEEPENLELKNIEKIKKTRSKRRKHK